MGHTASIQVCIRLPVHVLEIMNIWTSFLNQAFKNFEDEIWENIQKYTV